MTTPLAADGGEAIRVLAGDCTVIFDGDAREEYRGRLTTVVKPDNTVLVHDAEGYQPVAWLTRAAAVSCGTDPAVLARDDGDELRVVAHEEDAVSTYPGSVAGVPVGDCPDCGGRLVRAKGAITCLDCPRSHRIPRDATTTDTRCDCGLPRMRVARGEAFDCCVDRDCESLDDLVCDRFDGEWACPDCGSPLRILRRGGLIAGCDDYPDCERAFAVPAGVVVGDCACGLPRCDTPSGVRCLDATCDRPPADRA